MNERMERVLEKMRKKGIDQLLVSDPLRHPLFNGHHGTSRGKIVRSAASYKRKAHHVLELSVLCI